MIPRKSRKYGSVIFPKELKGFQLKAAVELRQGMPCWLHAKSASGGSFRGGGSTWDHFLGGGEYMGGGTTDPPAW